ncbi:MAG: class I SAM-dependent methyltransferase [Sphingobium sp.]
MTQSHDMIVRSQFGPRAAAYVESAVHAGGADLDHIADRVRELAPRHALDLGAGGGHVTYRMAPHAQGVTACDLSEEMVAAILAQSEAKGLGNVRGQVARAEDLPFAADSFDFLASRFSAHHWQDFEAGLREARRVLTPQGRALFIDVIAAEEPRADVHLQAVELLRDTSHVRDYRQSEWIAALGRAGFAVEKSHVWRLRMEFSSWTERMQTPQDHVVAIRSLQRQAPAEVARHFAIEEDGSFQIEVLMIEAR